MRKIFGFDKASRDQSGKDTAMSEGQFITAAEPFINMDISSLRTQYVTTALVEQASGIVRERLGDAADERLTGLIAEMLADIRALKAAYVEQCRYKDPQFNSVIPEPQAVQPASKVEIDLRGDITGGNWWHPEPDGRWAGPENESSLFFPRLSAGTYTIEISIADEIEPGVIDGLSILIDGKTPDMDRQGETLPCVLRGQIELADDQLLPFHVMKLQFPSLRSPAEFGSKDDRRLAVRVSTVTLSKVAL